MGYHFLFHRLRFQKQDISLFSLSFIWFAGLLVGKCVSSHLTSIVTELFHSAVILKNSLFFDILISGAWFSVTYLIICRMPLLIMPFVFLKALLFGFSSEGCAIAFGSAGWLVRNLLMFSGSIHSLLFLVLCFTGLQEGKSIPVKLFLKFLIAAIIVELIDYLVVSRFLISLF